MRIRGRVLEVEVDHRKMTYANFIKLVSSLGGKILFKDGWWPVARYRLVMPKRRAKEFLKLLESEEALHSGGLAQIT